MKRSLTVFALVLMACSNASAPSNSASTSSSAGHSTTPDKSEKTTPSVSAAKPASDSALSEGASAPDVELILEDGKKQKLSSLKGQMVALYFYPKDDTPGCTVEAQGIRDKWSEFEGAKIKVFGVSTQDAASHKEFIAKHKLPFQLVVDQDGTVAKAFGVPVNAGFAARQSFLVGPDGKIKKIWRSVTPANHASELLSAAAK